MTGMHFIVLDAKRAVIIVVVLVLVILAFLKRE
jgi:hypothetical protein